MKERPADCWVSGTYVKILVTNIAMYDRKSQGTLS